MRGQQVAYLVLATLTVAVLLALPAGVLARETGGTCPNPALYGQSDDVESWFQLPPYAFGRNAEHIYFGTSTVEVEIHDLSTEHNFRIKDISWNGTHYNRVTGDNGDPSFTGTECWLVPLEVRSGVESGDYLWQSDQDPNLRYGVFINHPVGGPPPPPPPPPPSRAASATRASAAPRPAASSAADPRLHLHLGPRPADRRLLRRRQAHDADTARHLHHPGARPFHVARLPPDGPRRSRPAHRRRRDRASDLDGDLPSGYVYVQVRRARVDEGHLRRGDGSAGAASLQGAAGDREASRACAAGDPCEALQGRSSPLQALHETARPGRRAEPRAGRTLVNGARVNLVVSRGPG